MDIVIESLNKAIELSKEQGYITFDDIMDISIEAGLGITEVDKLASLNVNKGIIVYDEEPARVDTNETIEYDDYAQINYDEIFDKVIMLNET